MLPTITCIPRGSTLWVSNSKNLIIVGNFKKEMSTISTMWPAFIITSVNEQH